MKNLILIALIVSSILGLQAAPANASRFGELPVARIPAKINVNGDSVTAGTSRIMVRQRLGTPTYVIADGSWLYSNYLMHVTAGDEGRLATLIVRFTAGQVSGLTLADQFVAVALRDTPRHPAANPVSAVASSRR